MTMEAIRGSFFSSSPEYYFDELCTVFIFMMNSHKIEVILKQIFFTDKTIISYINRQCSLRIN